MILLGDPRWLLLLPPLFALVIWAWRDGPFHLGPRRKLAALLTRLAIVTAVVLGLCGPSVALPQGRQAVVFVADLSASNASNRSAMESTINDAVLRRPGDDEAGVVSVGRDAVVEQPSSPLESFDGFQSSVDADYTDLERGLELAGATLPDGYRRRVVVMTDGQQNVGDALAAARLLHSQGVRVDVVPERVTGGPDVRVDRVGVPSQLHTRERFSLSVSLHSTANTAARIDVYRDHALLASRRETVMMGESQYQFPQEALGPGFHTYQVRVSSPIDTQPQNNIGSALTSVQGAPRVLVIADARAQAVNVLHSLQSTGIDADLQSPAHVLPTLAYLQRYAAVVIVDTPAVALDPALVKQLVPYVRDLGHGLAVVGGEDAYGLGGYGKTPLEQVLPVKMELAKRRQLPSVAVALVIESLEAPMPVNISKEAGKAVIKLLTEQDLVAVNQAPDNGTPGWIVPLQHPRDKASMYRAISRMVPGDPPSYTPFLRSAYLMLKGSRARIKHIILLGDGDPHDPAYANIVRQIRGGGVTVSTVATNADTREDFKTMRSIARWGGGRYYRADDVTNVPRIFLREARTIARSGVVAGKFYPRKLSANPIVRDMRGVPPLFGYVATSAKPSAEVVLAGRKHDPVLATWQFGLGRAAAWTSDAAGLWTKSWLTAPGANRFWADLVSWTFPASTSSRLFVAMTSAGGQGQISVNTPLKLGIAPTVTARVVGPNLHTTTVQLQPSAPGQYRATFPATSQGAYFVSVEARGAGHAEVGQGGVDVPYSAEYQTTGTDLGFIRGLASAGGGSVETGPQSVWQDNLDPVYDQRPVADLLWLLALLLLPIDIALRRLMVSRRDVAALRAALSFDTAAPTPIPQAQRAGQLYSRRPHAATARSGPRMVGALLAGLQSRLQTTPSSAPLSTPSSAGKPAVPPRTARRAAAPAPSTASRLLEAKRRRQAANQGDASFGSG